MADQHTGGTWRIAAPAGGNIYGAVVSDVKPSGRKAKPEDDALEVGAYGGYLIAESIAPQDRPIIAAAPAMLDALREVANGFGHHAACATVREPEMPCDCERRQVLAAIAQATGIGQNVDVRA